MYMLEKKSLKALCFNPLIRPKQFTHLQAYIGVTHQRVLHRHYTSKMFCNTILRPSIKLSQALQKLLHHFLMSQCQQWHPFAPLLLPTFLPLL